MVQEKLTGLIGALVEVAVKFETSLIFHCDASNDMLRSCLPVDHQGCGFGKKSRDDQYVVIYSPKWNKKLWEGAFPYND